MNNLLQIFTSELRNLLNEWLPQLSFDWWKRYVLDVLTCQQQERVKQSHIVELSGLDLAALLRVLDQNWYELSSQHNWPKEARNWLKEAQTIRNRWRMPLRAMLNHMMLIAMPIRLSVWQRCSGSAMPHKTK